MCTQADREWLVVQGLTIAGKHIQLQNDVQVSARRTVKITLRDLPLHAVDNAQVLEVLSENWAVTLEISYGTLWHNGQPTSIRNGDRYFYIMEDVTELMPDSNEFGEYTARVFKPPKMMKYRHCGEAGHKANDLRCVVLAPETIAEMVETV